MFNALRNMRHGPLRRFGPFWTVLGNQWRKLARAAGGRISVRHRVGRYGPFRLDGYFAFSDFGGWGHHHNEGFEACIEACRGRRCVFDIGAHIGLVSLPMASVIAPEGLVVAFEPAKANQDYLRRHIALNGMTSRIRIAPSLVGGEETQVVFHEFDHAAGMNTVATGLLRGKVNSRPVTQTTIDAFCAGSGLVPEVIKVDVEGAEIGVLEGARMTLAKYNPIVFLSVHPRQIAALGRSIDELRIEIARVGYECRTIDGAVVTEFGLREYRLQPIQTTKNRKL
ncbi:MAG: FkbM family methyltransferase [Pseudorhodoplanes sp.]|nr:FkbM family methyltransferase [Pseudorhodoplanes sp.]